MSTGQKKWAEEGYPMEASQSAMVLIDRKELAQLRAENAALQQQVKNAEMLYYKSMEAKEEILVALAEQNKQMREAILYVMSFGMWNQADLEKLVSSPDLATPVINRWKAEGMREAAEYLESFPLSSSGVGFSHLAATIRAKATELEGKK